MGCKNVGDKKRKNDNQTKKFTGNEVIIREEHIERGPDGKVTKVTKERIVKKGNDYETPRKKEVPKNTQKSSSSTQDPSKSEFQKDALNTHNEYRRKHKAPPLQLDSELCNISQKYAEKLARLGRLEHSQNTWNGNELGENIFMCYGRPITGKSMTKSWYDEIKDYNFSRPGFDGDTGHFTQVVWVSSSKVGFGFAKNAKGEYYGVANYYPPGNYDGEFKENVLR